MSSIILSFGNAVSSMGNVCTSFNSFMKEDSSDWMFFTTVLTFLISILCTAKVYKRKRRELFIVCQDSHFNLKVASSLSLKIGDYEPPWWYNRHFGTMIPFGYNPAITYEREIFTEEDACFAVDWFPRKPDLDSTLGRTIKICVFYPGLGLGSQNVTMFFLSYFLQVLTNAASVVVKFSPPFYLQKFAQQFVLAMSKEGFYSAIITSRGVDIPLKTSRYV